MLGSNPFMTKSGIVITALMEHYARRKHVNKVLSFSSKFKASLVEKLEYLRQRRSEIEPFADPLTVQYDKDLAKLKYELDEQIQQLYVQIHNAEYSNFCKSLDFILGVEA